MANVYGTDLRAPPTALSELVLLHPADTCVHRSSHARAAAAVKVYAHHQTQRHRLRAFILFQQTMEHRVDELVRHLSTGMHDVAAERAKSAEDLKESIDRGYVLLKFTGTEGGTELGVRLDRVRCRLGDADFVAGSGSVHLVGALVLNFNEVELIADVDVGTRLGQGKLTLIADEAEWRAKRLSAEVSAQQKH